MISLRPDLALMDIKLAGALSGVLDNAPTYLAFFNLAGGDAPRLMGEGAAVLAALEAVAARTLPTGFGGEWTDTAFQEKRAEDPGSTR